MGASSPMNCDIRKDKHTFILDVIAYQKTFVYHSLNFITLTIFFPLLLTLRCFFLSVYNPFSSLSNQHFLDIREKLQTGEARPGCWF